MSSDPTGPDVQRNSGKLSDVDHSAVADLLSKLRNGQAEDEPVHPYVSKINRLMKAYQTDAESKPQDREK